MRHPAPTPLYLALVSLLAALLACGFPAAGPAPDLTATFGAALTQAVGTAQALPAATGTPVAQVAPTNTSVPPTPVPPTNTPNPTGCSDNAQFVTDVTIPDGTLFASPSIFVKTWRLKNSGSCTWNASYTLKFSQGDQLSGPPAVAFPGLVPPGSTVDLSVSMTSPAAPGTYTGKWQLVNASGAGFYTVFVKIEVPGTPTPTSVVVPPTATPTSSLIILPPVLKLPLTVTLSASSSGGIFSPPATLFGAPNAGDDESNRTRQGFVTFDLTGLPSGSTLSAVSLVLTPFDNLGNPFSLGCLRVYQQAYGTLDTSDFFSSAPSGALWRFCSTDELNSAGVQAGDAGSVAAVQGSLASGKFQIRLQFNETATNNNGTADLLRPTPKLVVTYTH